MNDSDRIHAPEQLRLPGALASEPPRSSEQRLPRIVHDLVDAVPPDGCTAADARERVARWLSSRHAIGGFRPETVYGRFAFELRRVRKEIIPGVLHRFVPREHHARLALLGPRTNDRAHDPLALIRAAHPAHGGAAARWRFEAQRDLALAYLSLWLVTDAELTGSIDRERWDQERKTDRDRSLFLLHLRKQGVICGDTRTSQLRICQDPAPPHRCTGIDLPGKKPFLERKNGKGITRKTRSVDVLTLALEQKPTVLLIPRRKGILQTMVKMLLLRLDTPLHVPDRRGVRFLYRTEQELEAGSDFIGRKICLGLSHKSHLAAEDAPVNPYAAPNLRIVKDSAAFYDRTLEVQHLLGSQHMDILYSMGPENFLLYHRRQYTAPDGLLMELFPPAQYGVDWQRPEVQLRMDDHIRTSLAP